LGDVLQPEVAQQHAGLSLVPANAGTQQAHKICGFPLVPE